MNLDELRARLDELGIPHDGWGSTGEGPVESPLIGRYKGVLVKMRDMLQGQVDEDNKKVAELYATVQRMKHGGGV